MHESRVVGYRQGRISIRRWSLGATVLIALAALPSSAQKAKAEDEAVTSQQLQEKISSLEGSALADSEILAEPDAHGIPSKIVTGGEVRPNPALEEVGERLTRTMAELRRIREKLAARGRRALLLSQSETQK